MIRFFRLTPFFLAFALLLASQPALAGKRVALVVANSAYQNAPPLPNPANDGALIAQTLKDAGFDVVDSRHDLSAIETRRALRDFADVARGADIAIVYYAGHGLEVDGSNYLIPVDARLERDTDVYDEALSLDRILVAVEPARQLRLVILDACRDSPFAKTMKRTLASRGLGRGLAQIEPTSPNTLIAYSAKAGMTALDGDGKNSPFTVALANHLTTPGLDVRRAFGFVRDDVLRATGNRQEPFVYGSLGGDDMPLVPAKAAPVPSAAADPQTGMRRDYELALQVGSKAAFEAFLAQHPEGFYANLAKLQLEKISAEQAHAVAVERSQQAEQERARLAAQGAEKDAQAKADADAKAAERARLAAETAQAQAQQQAAEAERQRASLAAAAPAAPGPAAQPSSQGVTDKGTAVAALGPSPTQSDLTRSVQIELRRVGCLTAAADGQWNTASRRSLSLFNRHAGTKFDVKVASLDALDAIKLKQSWVCPLACARGYKADGDNCSKIVCGEGTFLNDNNQCEKRRAKPANTAKRDDGAGEKRAMRAPSRPQAAARPQGGSGQIYCDAYLCRPVARGCHLEYRGGGGPGNVANAEVCN